ncbi:MAG: valine--tRNA ligase, partial [Flavobacteriales bacterium]
LLQERPEETLLCTSPFPTRSGNAVDGQLLADFDQTTRIVAEVRGIRQKGHIPNKQPLDLKVIVDTEGKPYPADLESVVCHLCNVTGVERVEEKVTGAFGFVVETHEFFIPAGDAVDLEAEKDKIRKDLEYQQGFLNIVRKKLSNEKFVNGAPEQVVASERAKEADAVAKIEVLQAQLDALG